MNLHMLLESTLLIGAAFFCFKNKWGKLFSVMSLFVFFLVFTTQIFTKGLNIYFSYADVTECILVTLLYITLLYKFSREWNAPWWQSHEILLCIGLLMYFSCSVPYITMMYYLQEKNPALNHLLFDLISNVLACARYALVAIAFWMVRQNTLSKVSYE